MTTRSRRSAWGLDTADDGLDWRQKGECRQHDPDLWAGDAAAGNTRYAIGLCGKCPVKAVCLQWGVEHQAVGVYGGQLLRGPRRRRYEIRKQQPNLTCALPGCGREFKANSSSQRFCTSTCWYEWRVAKRCGQQDRPVDNPVDEAAAA